MSATLASMKRLIQLLGERDSPATVPPTLRSHLITATSLLSEFLGMPFAGENTETVLTFDTSSSYKTYGLSLPVFDRRPFPVFDMPVNGILTGLRVQYADGKIGPDNWTDVEDLNGSEQYEYDAVAGRLRLLFHPRDGVRNLRVSFGTSGTSRPDIKVGEDLRTATAKMLITATAPLDGQKAIPFRGALHKKADDCLGVGVGGGFSLVDTFGTGFESMLLAGPRDRAVASGDFALDFIASEATGQLSPREGWILRQSYPDVSPPLNVGFTVEGNDLLLSTLQPGFYHETWRHLDGIIPDTVSQACAMLARFLHGKTEQDGVGKTSDKTRRGYTTGGVIPPEIRDMVSNYRRTRSSVRFI